MANIFSKIGQAWSNMPLKNKLYMGTVITDKLAGSYNFGGLGLAMAGAAMKLDGQPGTFSSKGGGTKPPSAGDALKLGQDLQSRIPTNTADASTLVIGAGGNPGKIN